MTAIPFAAALDARWRPTAPRADGRHGRGDAGAARRRGPESKSRWLTLTSLMVVSTIATIATEYSICCPCRWWRSRWWTRPPRRTRCW